jgi:hypothetical protein
MNVADDCRSELLVGARRGRLSDAGRIALDAHLATCASCRMSRELGADFDGADAVDLHDGARIHALADRARAAVVSAGSAVNVGKAVGRRVGRPRVCARSQPSRRWSSFAAPRAPPSGGCAGRRRLGLSQRRSRWRPRPSVRFARRARQPTSLRRQRPRRRQRRWRPSPPYGSARVPFCTRLPRRAPAL